MMIVYQKGTEDAIPKCRVVKIIFRENFCREIRQAGLAVNAIRWVEATWQWLLVERESA